MPNIKTLLPVGLSIAVVLLFLFMGWQILDARGDVTAWKDKHAALALKIETANTEAQRLTRQRDSAQAERDRIADTLATQDVVEQEPVVQYVTREVVKYVEAPVERCVLPADWVRIYNTSGTGALGTGEAETAPATDAGAAEISNDARRSDTGQSGLRYSRPEQPELPGDIPAVATATGLDEGAEL